MFKMGTKKEDGEQLLMEADRTVDRHMLEEVGRLLHCGCNSDRLKAEEICKVWLYGVSPEFAASVLEISPKLK